MSHRVSTLICASLLFAVAACESSILDTEQPPEAPLIAAAALGGTGPVIEDVMNQGGVGVYAANGARLVRQPNGLRASVSVPTPTPGSYVYAAGTTAGHPEVYTLWAFVFNNPQNCTDPCNGDDLGGATGANGGAYNIGGVVASGSKLTISGRIGVGEAPRGGLPLESPGAAEVHLALAPHGAFDPSTMPGELRIPKGSPNCGCWWVAIIK